MTDTELSLSEIKARYEAATGGSWDVINCGTLAGARRTTVAYGVASMTPPGSPAADALGRSENCPLHGRVEEPC
jgi:hypothetical protein